MLTWCTVKRKQKKKRILPCFHLATCSGSLQNQLKLMKLWTRIWILLNSSALANLVGLRCWRRNIGLNPGVTDLDWKRSSGWLESWEGFLLVTDISTACEGVSFQFKNPGEWANKSPSQDSNYPDDLFQSGYY